MNTASAARHRSGGQNAGHRPDPGDDRFRPGEGIRIIFVQKGFDTKSAGLIAREIGGEVVVMDPLDENWMEGLKRFALALRKAAR